MRYLSLFSGIEAATTAWHPLGWECVGVSEIEPFPCALLAHHYPNVPNLGDVTKITEQDIQALGQIDLVVFGSPCQDLSVAGKRKGFEGERSGLFYPAINIIQWARKHGGCRWALWENVPGAFTSSGGADFAAVVELLAGLESITIPPKGWGTEGCAVGSEAMVEWAVLDAQWFGVAQRRRRVFAIADFGNWFSRPPILLEPEGLRGNTAPSREAGQATAGCLTARTCLSIGVQDTAEGHIRPVVNGVVAIGNVQDGTVCTLSSREHKGLSCGRDGMTSGAVVYGIPGNWIGRAPENGGNATEPMHDVAPCQTRTDQHGVVAGMQVRRLTPIECERLQGFPDNYTLIPVKGKPAANGPRYKALGNSMAVPVMRWIGQRIDAVALFQ